MKALKYLLRAIGVIAALCLFALGLSVLFYTVVEGIKVLETILGFSAYEGRVIYNAMGILDLILLSFSIFIVAIGIYELFVAPIEQLPNWLQVDDLDALKDMLIKIIVPVMGITFLGRVVGWNGEDDLLSYGLAIAAVVVALSYFLSIKSNKKE
jgi:uncharacterized membrane protein YqhA